MATMATRQAEDKLEQKFQIEVNRKPVDVEGPLTTGLAIKEAAIEQGVSIGMDFQLAKVDPDGKHIIVGNSDKVDVSDFKIFFATRGDDNS